MSRKLRITTRGEEATLVGVTVAVDEFRPIGLGSWISSVEGRLAELGRPMTQRIISEVESCPLHPDKPDVHCPACGSPS